MKHYGKRIHAFNCPKLQRTILTLVSIMFVCMYVYVVNTLMIVYLFFKFNVAKFSFLLDECKLCNS